MLDEILNNLKEQCQINPRQPILIGVSGGPDSIALLHILHQFGFPLIVAHFHHMIRPEADQEADGVKQITIGLKLPYLMGKEDVRGFAEQNSISIEEAARMLRYKFLFEKANEMNVQAVAVGHTADDQVETVLMHLIRGSGLDGLAGMCFRMLPNAWSEAIPLIRPLLSTWRKDVLRYIDDQHLQVFYDQSNLDSTYFRNRIRHELVPLLESYNPQIKKVIWRTAQALRADNEELNTSVESAWQNCFIDAGSGYVQFDTQKLDKLSLSLKRCLLRKGFNILHPGLQELDFDAVNRAVVCLARQTLSGGCDLISGIRFRIEGQSCWLIAGNIKLPLHHGPHLSSGNSIILTIPGEMYFNDSWIIRGDIIDRTSLTLVEAQQNPDPYQAWIDYDQVILPIRIRTRNSDDRFQPLGIFDKIIKLSDFMANVKIPQRARNEWPLLCDRNELIIWVPGYRIAHPCRVTDSTSRILHLQMQELDRK